MAGERTLPGLGLTGYWDLGDNTWKAGMDTNMLLLSVLGGGAVDSREATEPGSPADGDIVIATADWGGGEAVNSIQVRDNGAWVELVPTEGWTMRDAATDENLIYDGSAWAVIEAGGGGGGGGGSVAPAKYFQFNNSSAIALTAAFFGDLVWDNIEANTTGGTQDVSTGGFVVPAALNGKVMQFTAGVRYGASESGALYFTITRAGGSTENFGGQQNLNSGEQIVIASPAITVETGDIIRVQVYTVSAASVLSSTSSFFSGWEIAGESALAFETSAFQGFAATAGSTQAIPATTGTQVEFETELFDTDAAYDDSTFFYTVPAAFDGKYMTFAAGIRFSAGETGTLYLQKDDAGNGTFSNFASHGFTALSDWALVSGAIQVATGDRIKVNVYTTSAATVSDDDRTRFSGYVIGESGSTRMVLSEETAAFSLDDTMLGGNVYKEANFASDADITVPPGLVGTEPIVIEATGAGVVSFVEGAGVTINSLAGALDIAGQYGVVTLTPKGSNVYTLAGALA